MTMPAAARGGASRWTKRCVLAIWLGAMAACGWAQADNPMARFADVKKWRGRLSATTQFDEVVARNAGFVETVSYRAAMNVEFLLEASGDSPVEWRGSITRSNLESSYRSIYSGLNEKGQEILAIEKSFETNGPLELSPNEVPRLRFSQRQGWTFGMRSRARRPVLVTSKTTYHELGRVESIQVDAEASVPNTSSWFPIPATGLVLFGEDTKRQVVSMHGYGASSGAAVEPDWVIETYLEPAEMDELRLEIEEPENYRQWRPTTTPDARAGESLTVKARVTTKDGGKPRARVKQFVWDLAGTSAEPGVAMNYPLEAKDTRYDLDLHAEGAGVRVSDDKQRAERDVSGLGVYDDTIKILPFDWGGWSTLQVTAVMDDGRRV